MNRSIFTKLAKLHIITPGGIFHLAKSFSRDGISLMALLRFSAHYYPDRCALVSEGERLTYKEMYESANQLAKVLFSDYSLKAGMCVGLLCRSHMMGALLLPALSRLGVKVKLLNTGMAQCKLNDLIKKNKIDLLIYDPELKNTLIPDDLPCATEETEDLYHRLSNKDKSNDQILPHIKRGGELSVFTGGTSGKYKEAPRQMSIFQFLPPFFALLEKLRIDEYDSVFLPLPVYHGFGLATLVISLLMGKKVCLVKHFDADKALKIISEEKTEVLPVVPAMLARLWQAGNAPTLMKSVRCVICGGDRLDRKWITATNEHLGNVIFNLFGTSEAGFFMVATPDDLSRNEEVTIGRPISGVKCQIKDADSNGTGSLWVRSGWAMINMKDKWQDTGDLVYRNSEGCYFYRGRTDNMVVCGGENVYPENVERIINGHPDVLASLVFPVSDPQFGTVLNAQVELIQDSSLTPDGLKSWLHSRLSRAEMPHLISIQPIHTSETGKKTRDI
ncbi:MAG: AMP-binding protein [Muribaculaceae bacterium]|nr:AMP-binding protein [Muribaculaceae bacterium]